VSIHCRYNPRGRSWFRPLKTSSTEVLLPPLWAVWRCGIRTRFEAACPHSTSGLGTMCRNWERAACYNPSASSVLPALERATWQRGDWRVYVRRVAERSSQTPSPEVKVRPVVEAPQVMSS